MITLNVNGLNAPTKRLTLTGWMKHVHVCTSSYHITLLDPHTQMHKMILYCQVNHVPTMTCSGSYLLFFIWLLMLKTDKYLLLLSLCKYYSLNTIVSGLVNRKIIELYITKLGFNRKTCNHFLKSRCISEIYWHFLKNTNAQVFLFSPELQICFQRAVMFQINWTIWWSFTFI